MILKTKTLQNTQTPQTIAGQKQEQDVAFYLRRAFKDHPEVLVINDFRFTFNGETAQIDHLIIYPYGFVLIESKSIKGHVDVNQHGEWTRSHGNNWFGMPSPIKQVELQQSLLKEMLKQHRSEILGKLLGIRQQGFGMRCWDHLCAVSSDAVINRETMPAAVSEQLVKTEFLVEKLEKIMNLKSKFFRIINVSDPRPDFNQEELNSIAKFLIDRHLDQSQAASEITPVHTPQIKEPVASFAVNKVAEVKNQPISQPTTNSMLRCKHCGESTNYTPMYGKFGYYIKCNQCTKNTPMKQACPQCQSKNIKIQKRNQSYTLTCQDCSHSSQVI
ncbi:NERD domain-containing protein [Shewanella seohaensis]|uniref:nuclease-related domain-containing protein n=1 Tax=Shewanella seohaensis TaxID=755175 RepID=UPI00200E6E8F|nr:nuclease-related domain-containing protein [Shewanella seohaensis]MCL1119359.1 NERD domain-containing protein [Shewanella seohaensis]UXM81946.1 NERD domain-containing protein [Shewanella seohaensis]